MNKNFICEVCGKEVEQSELYRIKNPITLTGHKQCIQKQLENQGLNESTAQIQKTNFLLG